MSLGGRRVLLLSMLGGVKRTSEAVMKFAVGQA